MKKCWLLFLIDVFLVPISLHASAVDLWVTQTGAGSQNGSSLSNAAPVAFLSTPSSCGSGPLQVGPGTTIHLSGAFTFPQLTSENPAINFGSMRCIGSAGSPIWLKTEPGFVCQSPVFGHTGGGGTGGCIQVSAASGFTPQYITIGGATPCGAVNGVDSPNTCDGVIRDTANGTAYTYQYGSVGITMNGCANCEVKNLEIGPTYIRTPNFNFAGVSCTAGACVATCPSTCTITPGVKFVIAGGSPTPLFAGSTVYTVTANTGGNSIAFTAGTITGTQTGGTFMDESTTNNFWYTSVSMGPGYGGNLADYSSVHDCKLHDAGWVLTSMQGAGMSFYNNSIYNYDHGIAAGPWQAVSPGFTIYGNHFGSMAIWDDSKGSDGTPGYNNNHHDGIHLQIDVAGNTPQWGFSGTWIYNNVFSGNVGTPNQWLFLRAATSGMAVFNNVFDCSPASTLTSIGYGDDSYTGSYTTNLLIANNTLLCTGAYNAGGGGLVMTGVTPSSGRSITGVQVLNNIARGNKSAASLGTLDSGYFAANGIDYNLYQRISTDSGFAPGAWPFTGYNNYTHCIDDSRCDATQDSNPNNYCWGSSTGSFCQHSILPAGSGQDAHSALYTAAGMKLNGDGTPQAGSPAIGAGTNLTSLCVGPLSPLCKDKAGNSRPVSGPWDVGAFSSSSAQQLMPPTALTAIPH